MFSSYFFWANLPFIFWFSLIFHCLKAYFVPCPKNKMMVTDLTTRESEHCWWFLLWNRCPLHRLHKSVSTGCTISCTHYNDVIMSTMASQITSLRIIYSTVYSGADQRKHQSSASLAFVRGIHRSPVNSLHKWPATRKMFPFDDVIMIVRVLLCFVSVPLVLIKYLLFWTNFTQKSCIYCDHQ